MAPPFSSTRIPPAEHFDRLLGLCARATDHPDLHPQLRAAASDYGRWEALGHSAETHGIAPLVHHHLRAAGIELPPDGQRMFSALALRHRKTQAIREQVLAELLQAFAQRSVPLLLLKGAALAFSVYPKPALRSMRDVDLLVRPEDLLATGEILRGLGYAADDEAGWATATDLHHHHQPERVRVIDGLTVTLEVHRMLGIRDVRLPRTLDQLWERSVAFSIGGEPARTLGPTDMLVHVQHHGFNTRLHWPDRLRLLSVADVVTLVETQLPRIDWPMLRAEQPRLWQALAWITLVTPWSEAVRTHVGWPQVPALGDVGRDYTGWPRERVPERRGELLRLWKETFAPPAWWLRMRHGGAPGALGYLGAWWKHFDDVVL